jgi:hypothetical protein
MPAYTRHNEILILDSVPGHVEAQYFNVAQTALKRVGEQWRFKIPGLNHLDVILQEDAWIVVDRVLNDMPVAAWTNFQTEGRDNLHEPVACDIRIYHFAARMVLQTTLNAMENHLRQSLAEQKTMKADNVLAFNNDE